MDKIVHEETGGTYAEIEISKHADNTDQKIKLFSEVHKTEKLLWEAYF